MATRSTATVQSAAAARSRPRFSGKHGGYASATPARFTTAAASCTGPSASWLWYVGRPDATVDRGRAEVADTFGHDDSQGDGELHAVLITATADETSLDSEVSKQRL